MKYTRFGKRKRAWLEEEFAQLEERRQLGPVVGVTGARFGGAAGRRPRRELPWLQEERERLQEERERLQEERERLEDARSACFLLVTAVRLIPRSERARYLEEFRAELLDVPRDTRLSHALSLLRGVFVLRLRRGHSDKATNAVVRRAED
ncbi:MAG: hypothetical protein ACRDTA_07490 [Pseudonocardiaceae bacterium]